MIRPTISISMPVAIAETTEPSPNMVSIATYAPRCPIADIIQELSNWLAVIVARKAVAIHCAWSWPMPNAPITFGTATLTRVDVMTAEVAPNNPAIVTNHR